MAECDTCGKNFPSGSHAAWQHADALGHRVKTWDCRFCNDTFYEQDDLEEHYADDHYFCWDCERSFNNRNNYDQHRRSRAHVSTSIPCPFRGNGFTTATGVTHHVERGSCPNAQNINRDKLYKMLRQRDPQGVITKNLLEWSGSSEYSATSKSWNSRRQGYECYFCNRLFNSLRSLNQHLQSPAHQENLYHCPKRGCPKEFTTLAAAINHLESESCQFMRFSDVQRNVQNVLSSNRMLEF